jgi:transcriptional regulator with XRE-family HTH domain
MPRKLRNNEVTETELVDELARRVEKMSQAKIARRLRIKPPIISNILRGAALPCGKVLRWLGYERVVVYRRLEP